MTQQYFWPGRSQWWDTLMKKRILNSVKYLYQCHMWDNGNNYSAQFSDGEDVGSGIGLGTLLTGWYIEESGRNRE